MKHKKKNSNFLRTIIYIIMVITAIITVYVGFYAYSVINHSPVITIGVGESYTLETADTDSFIRSYGADIVTPQTASTVIGNDTGEAIVGVKHSYFDRDFYRFEVIDAPTKITLNKKSLILGAGETATISAKCSTLSHEFPVTHSSSNEKIATVDKEGNIQAVSVGECDIYAKAYNGISEKCKITVKNKPTTLSLNHTSLTLGVGEKVTLEPVFSENEYSSNITYSSSDEKVAVVLNRNELTAINTGKCSITATTHNGVTATCNLTVKKLPESVKLVTLTECDIDTSLPLVVDIPKDCATLEHEITISDESVLKQDEKNPLLLHPLKKGKATVTVTLSNGVKDEKTITVSDYKNAKIDNFKILNQFPSLPTGCEVVSLTSVLNHYGFDVSMHTMADEYMPTMEHNYFSYSPNDYFYGLPYSYEQGMGCYPGCIVKTAENYFKDKKITDYVAVDISGGSVKDVFNYIKSDVPVITWVTSGFTYPNVEGSWNVNGETFTWYEREHCLVTVGYNENDNTVTVADNAGGYTYTVSLSKYKEVFENMDSMAVVILKK